MSQESLVSVVIIFRDAEPYLDQAVASVFAQTHPNWELVLVDDGSTDGSSRLGARWAEENVGRVAYLDHTDHANLGMSTSRNLGIRHSQGAYIAFLDADDVWFPTTLAEQVALMQKWPAAAMVYGPIQWWYSWTHRAEDQERDFVEYLGVPAETLVQPPTLLPRFLRNKAAVPSGFLVRRTAVEQVGGFENAFRGEYEDQAFCAKICLEFAVFASGHCWYRYRQHPDSCVAVALKTGRSRAARLFFLRWLVAYVRTHNVRNPAVWWAVWYERWRWAHTTQYRLSRNAQYVLRRICNIVALRSRRLAGVVR
jgi:glycosyltransferase involved in cell wall biosynthesis